MSAQASFISKNAFLNSTSLPSIFLLSNSHSIPFPSPVLSQPVEYGFHLYHSLKTALTKDILISVSNEYSQSFILTPHNIQHCALLLLFETLLQTWCYRIFFLLGDVLFPFVNSFLRYPSSRCCLLVFNARPFSM